jgi:hypothetical protein
VVLMTKLMGIVTPLVLRLVVIVAPRLISYKTHPVRLYRTQVTIKIISYSEILIVKSMRLQWREEKTEKQGSPTYLHE